MSASDIETPEVCVPNLHMHTFLISDAAADSRSQPILCARRPGIRIAASVARTGVVVGRGAISSSREGGITQMPELQNSESNDTDRLSSILAGHVTPKELACALGVSERTLGRWHQFRQGPPRVEIGRKVFYRLESVSAWMVSRERPEPRADRVRRVRLRTIDPSRVPSPMQRNHIGPLPRPSGSHN